MVHIRTGFGERCLVREDEPRFATMQDGIDPTAITFGGRRREKRDGDHPAQGACDE